MSARATLRRASAPAAADVCGGETRLYELAALALAAYVHSRFRVRVLGARLRLAPGTLLVSTHRGDDDVPLLAAALYRRAHGRLRRGPCLHFVVRDDLFEPGFFAGYPSGLPRLARRALWPVGVGPVLRGLLPCHPARRPTGMRLVQLLRACPEAPLAELLPPPLLAPLRARAAAIGDSPLLARDVLSGDYADLLWRVTRQDEADRPAAAAFWSARRAGAARDFRELVAVVRAGRPLLICPEGRPSPDGRIGPLLGGVSGLVRRGRPAAVVPLAPAYDTLVAGRTHAFVGVGEPVEPVDDTGALLALLRRTTPLTVGSSVAAALADGDDPPSRLAADVEAARADGRPFEPELADAAVRRERVVAALRALDGRDLSRLVAEYRSARE